MLNPPAVMSANANRKKLVASICKWPHSKSPTTVSPVCVLYLACSECSSDWVCLNFSTLADWRIMAKRRPLISLTTECWSSTREIDLINTNTEHTQIHQADNDLQALPVLSSNLLYANANPYTAYIEYTLSLRENVYLLASMDHLLLDQNLNGF